MIFLKESDTVLTDDEWRIAIDIDLSMYQETISTIKADLLLAEQKREFTSISELQQIETLLQQLGVKLYEFHHFLPRMDRGLINLGSTVLKTLFGTATISDIYQLHNTLEETKSRNKDIVHSLSQQLTYIKKLGATSDMNTDVIANLSSIMKDNIIKSHNRF